ncbi:MAG: hypothetical protein ABFD16_10710, partial [Thermoguttaceae bacterium]
HGGGLYGGTREIYPQLKNQEIAVVSLGYRLHPKVTGDRELEMLGRYEENAYFMRLLKLVGHKNVTLYGLQGYDHGPVHLAAFLPMWRWVKKTLAEREQAETPKQEK